MTITFDPSYQVHRSWYASGNRDPSDRIVDAGWSDLANQSILAHLRPPRPPRPPGTRGPDDPGDAGDPGVLVHGPEDLTWSRADRAFLREMAAELARECIGAGMPLSRFIARCHHPAQDLLNAWMEREGITFADLGDIYRREARRMEAPSRWVDERIRDAWFERRDTRSKVERKARGISARLALAGCR